MDGPRRGENLTRHPPGRESTSQTSQALSRRPRGPKTRGQRTKQPAKAVSLSLLVLKMNRGGGTEARFIDIHMHIPPFWG